MSDNEPNPYQEEKGYEPPAGTMADKERDRRLRREEQRKQEEQERQERREREETAEKIERERREKEEKIKKKENKSRSHSSSKASKPDFQRTEKPKSGGWFGAFLVIGGLIWVFSKFGDGNKEHSMPTRDREPQNSSLVDRMEENTEVITEQELPKPSISLEPMTKVLSSDELSSFSIPENRTTPNLSRNRLWNKEGSHIKWFEMSNDGLTPWRRYMGELKNGVPHGKGAMAWVDNNKVFEEIYEGDFINGERSGYGIFVDSYWEEYHGNWYNDYRNGHGVQKYYNGDVYNGQWRNDQKHGKGVMYYYDRFSSDPEKDIYDGEWDSNNKSGYGTLTYADGSIYAGKWKNNKKYGKGIYTSADGRSVYEGEWLDGKEHGHGKLTRVGGLRAFNIYEGEWRNGEKHGQGKSMYPSSLSSGDTITQIEEWNNGKLITQKLAKKNVTFPKNAFKLNP